MKLTKLQRYTMYCILLEEADSVVYSTDGLCHMIYDVSGLQNAGFLSNDFNITKVINNYFPELAAKDTGHRFGHFDEFWFPNWAARRKALKQCIKETEPK